jgi:hypothetical protein
METVDAYIGAGRSPGLQGDGYVVGPQPPGQRYAVVAPQRFDLGRLEPILGWAQLRRELLDSQAAIKPGNLDAFTSKVAVAEHPNLLF